MSILSGNILRKGMGTGPLGNRANLLWRLLLMVLCKIDLRMLVMKEAPYLGTNTLGHGLVTGIGRSTQPRGIGSGIAQT